MAIYSACSDLETREIRWVSRDVHTDRQNTFAGQIWPAEGWWWAGCYADRYADDVPSVTID